MEQRISNFIFYIPHPISDEKFGEFLGNFPLNVKLSRIGKHLGRDSIFTAEYNFDPQSLECTREGGSMRYLNLLDPGISLWYSFDTIKRTRRLEKLNNLKVIAEVDGGWDWEQFFTQVALLPLVEGEKCTIRPL